MAAARWSQNDDGLDDRARNALAASTRVSRAGRRAEKVHARKDANRERFRADARRIAADYDHRSRMERHVREGQPSFPHVTHTVLCVVTAGAWVPVYGLHWLGSEQRRYQRARRGALRRQGLMDRPPKAEETGESRRRGLRG